MNLLPALFRPVFKSAIWVVVFFAAWVRPAMAETRVSFELPADEAVRSLPEFSRQADVEVVFATEIAKGVMTPAVSGDYLPSEALKLLLADTTLVASSDQATGAFMVERRPVPSATISGRISDADTAGYLFGALVTIRELGRTARSSSDGSYLFANVPAGKYTVESAYIGYQDETLRVTLGSAALSRADFAMESIAMKMDNFVVTGQRAGQARALQQKRYANSLMDVVSADGAGKLPDGNAAEAVRRLPGVFAEIDQGEGRFIVVRGIDANLNNVTINGLSVGSPGGGDRGTQMDAVPADLISRIEVVKAVTPDMDAQAIGASVNIVTPSAFDRAESFAYGTLGGGYFNGPGSDTPYNGSATFGTQFGGGKWGVVIGASYNYRHYISNRRSGGGHWYPAAATGEGANIFFPETQSLYYYDVQRWREGINANLEFRPNADSQYFFRVVNNHFKDDEGRDLNSFDFFRTAYPASFTENSAHFTGGRSTVEYRHYLQKHRINNYAAGGKNTLGDGSLTLDYTFSVGDTGIKVPERLDWQFRSSANLQSDIDTSTLYWKVAPEARWYDPATYPLRRLLIRSDDEYEDIYNAVANLKGERELFGHDGFWQVGLKYVDHKKGWDRLNTNYYPVSPAFTLADFDLTEEPREVFDGRYPMTPRIDFDKAQQFFRDNPQYFTLNSADSLGDSYDNYFRINEDLFAGYAMAKVNFQPFSVLAGVRIEDSRVKVEGIEWPYEDGQFLGLRPYHGNGHYTNILPGVHLRYDISPRWAVRAAWTNTIGRPSYSDIGVTRSFSFAPDEVGSSTYAGSIEDGNPGLEPYESMNFDVTSEYYFKNAGIFSVGAFHKQIKNPIYTYEYTERNVTFEGIQFSQLAYSKPLNADGGRITGFELNFQQQLTMLPMPFDGLGFAVNYTYADSSESLPTRPGEDLPFAKQAESLYNVALFYEKYGIEARLAYGFTGAFVRSYGDEVNGDSYQSERKTIDAKISYRINEHLSIYGDVINLGQEPLDEYAGRPEQNSATERYWWTANFGINWKL